MTETRRSAPSISENTLNSLRLAWVIWTEVGDLDRYPTTQEAGVIFSLAAEVNGQRFGFGHAELARRMADNYFYPYEDRVAQQRAFMFAPGSWDALSYVDKQAVIAKVASLPADRRLGLLDAYHAAGQKDPADPRGASYAALTLREQGLIATAIHKAVTR